jgi:phosphopantetheinyl transferase
LAEEDLTQITIKWGVFNQPLLIYPEKNPPKFSLSHTRAHSACLVFPQEHPMGIDIESYTHNDYKSVESLLTEKEKLLGSGIRGNIAEFYIQLWTIKEALSKTLQTGLMVPVEIYEIAEIHNFGSYYISTFKNFLQYKAISFRWKGNICSIVLPEKTHCDLKLLNAYME